jgi:uncharacterized integral membrane protein
VTLLITVPLTIFAALFAFSNTAEVTLTLFPFEEQMTLQLSFLGLGMLGIGFLSGALFVWIHSQKTAFRGWQAARRASRLEKELEKKEMQAAAR